MRDDDRRDSNEALCWAMVITAAVLWFGVCAVVWWLSSDWADVWAWLVFT